MLSYLSRLRKEDAAPFEKEIETDVPLIAPFPQSEKVRHHGRSASSQVSRGGFDEEKCRNVLVRYCAHVPRNYQYKDGIQLVVFLTLREHLGDENLDLAGGVLYELIEVDCEHTDDPGAAFQRWKHDHMSRYADFELPHVPHLTTITPAIVPTEKLVHWRADHPERYSFVLSDSSPYTTRSSSEQSCIRNRKAWMIDSTFYVSDRYTGTLPMSNPDPKKFHEMQWKSDTGLKGRLVEQREISVEECHDTSRELRALETLDSSQLPDEEGNSRWSLSTHGVLQKLKNKLHRWDRETLSARGRCSWLSNAVLEKQDSRERKKDEGKNPVPLPQGCHIPNAIFARKFMLLNEEDSIVDRLPVTQMPVAELKAADTIMQAAESGILEEDPSWKFRGPFTPQLGYDGGLDFRRTPRESRNSGHRPESFKNHRTPKSKRMGICLEPDESLLRMRDQADRDKPPLAKPDTRTQEDIFLDDKPKKSSISGPRPWTSQPDMANLFSLYSTTQPPRTEPERLKPLYFENVEFVLSDNRYEPPAPKTNRKTSLIQLPEHAINRTGSPRRSTRKQGHGSGMEMYASPNESTELFIGLDVGQEFSQSIDQELGNGRVESVPRLSTLGDHAQFGNYARVRGPRNESGGSVHQGLRNMRSGMF